jgi:hypothetical protein
MSVQLIVYPQTALTNEFVIDGTNFNTINTSSSYDSSSSGNVILDVLTNQPPSPINTWLRFRSTLFGTPTLPTETSGNLTLYSTTTNSLSGVYQKLSNLVVGTTYEIVIDLSTTGTGFVITSAYNGTTMITQPLHAANQSQITHTWTASSTDDTIVISYFNTAVDNIVISNISVSPQGVVPTTIFTDLQDGQVICDLYEDEDIPLSLSVDDFKNVAEKVQSYSKAFNLPATKRNNQIFDNIFEITRTDNGLNFNPYKRTKAILKQDGFLLFEGYLRMIDISDKSGEISYNVNLYSEVVALVDVLGDNTFSELDFTELTHNYNRTNIIRSWRDAGGGTSITYTNPDTSGFRDDYTTLRYPFVDWNKQWFLAASGGTPTVGNPQLTNLGTAFRPFINIKYLIDRIFQDVPFTYESEFFDTDDFKKLYMDFNWGADTNPVVASQVFNATWKFGTGASSNIGTGSYKELRLIPENITGGVAGSTVPPNYDTSTYVITATTDNEFYTIEYGFLLENTGSSQSIECRWLHTKAAGGVVEINLNNSLLINAGFSNIYLGNFQVSLDTGDTLKAQFNGDSDIRQRETGSSFAIFALSNPSTTSETLNSLRGELGQWEFLKGIMTMFNLVTLPDEDNPSNIRIEPYKNVFISSGDAANPNFFDNTSTELNWTDKIDVSEMKLLPLTDLNKKTIFKFVEDEDDFAFMNYKRQVGGHLYGSKKYDASEFTILAGEDEIIAEPFAATVVKPLEGIFPDFITPAIYSMDEDEVTKGFENSPRIMYNNGIKSTGASYFIPEQNGVTSSNEDDFLQFSHLTNVPTTSGTRDFHFGECQLIPPVGAPTNNNLFNLYWLPYYAELYNPDTRIMTIKVNLSPSDINTFKFNDTVFIKNRTFRVNKIDYKPNDLATVEFILIP